MGKKILGNLVTPLILFFIVAVIRLKYPLWLLFFGFGGILGTFILESEGIISRKFEIKDKIFHTFLFQVIFAVLTFYVLTSTSSAMASGVCIFAYLNLLKGQVSDLKLGSLSGWEGFFGLTVPYNLQRFWVGGGILILLYFVYILVR